jgi:hypothetical protein
MPDPFESAPATEETVREYLLSPHGAHLSAAEVQAVMSSPNSFLRHGLKEGLTARRIGDALIRGWRLDEQRKQREAERIAAAQEHLDARGGFDTYEGWFDAKGSLRSAESAIMPKTRTVNERNVEFPIPDRSDHKPQLPDIEAARHHVVMNDGRPAVIEDWWAGDLQALVRTVFYSTLGTGGWSEADHYSYIRANGLLEGKTDPNSGVGLTERTDASGSQLWSATVVMHVRSD